MDTNLSKFKGLEQQVIFKAMENSAFREELIKNPRGTIESHFGVKIPEDIKILVKEDAPDTYTLVLPPQDSAKISWPA